MSVPKVISYIILENWENRKKYSFELFSFDICFAIGNYLPLGKFWIAFGNGLKKTKKKVTDVLNFYPLKPWFRILISYFELQLLKVYKGNKWDQIILTER